MWQPAHIDGRSLVIFKKRNSVLDGFEVVASGELHFDGEVLRLRGQGVERVITEEDLESIQPVSAQSKLEVCRPYDFFMHER